MKPSSTLEATGSAAVVNSGISGKQRGKSTKESKKQTTLFGARPLERNLSIIAVLLASVGVIGGLVRELTVGSSQTHFIATLAIPSLLIALGTSIALRNQDEAFRPWWSAATYLALIGMAVFVPAIAGWSLQMGFGASPAIVPALACMICVLAPFAVSNQVALGLGSAVPKILIVLWAMHMNDSSQLGIVGDNLFQSPQTALVALAMFTAASSVLMMFFRYRMPAWMMLLIGALVTVPCISKLDFCLVHLGVM